MLVVSERARRTDEHHRSSHPGWSHRRHHPHLVPPWSVAAQDGWLQVIDTVSLAHRITIGKLKERRMTEQPKYRVIEGTTVLYGKTRTVYTVVRSDGTPAGYGPGADSRIAHAEFFTRETAEFHCAFVNGTLSGYRISREIPRSGSVNRTAYWLLTGSITDDPSTTRQSLGTDWTQEGTSWPEGTGQVDVLIRWANQHAEGAAGRIAKKAEKDAIEAAEAAVREAREAQLAEARATKGELATVRQVDYILQLLAAREQSGEGGGFYIGPRDRAGIEELSKGEASLYITSLKGDY
jgi:hypothetical protein